MKKKNNRRKNPIRRPGFGYNTNIRFDRIS